MSYLKAAFDKMCPDAEQAKDRWVTLYERVSYYGGPEEGGWWGTNVVMVATKRCTSKDAAEKLLEEVKATAAAMGEEATRSHGERCGREMDWCEARGLDADYLPEPDGPSDFFVVVEEEPGAAESSGPRNYE